MAKGSNSNLGFILGIIGTIAGGVIIKKTCDKNIVDGASKLYDNAKDSVKKKIAEHKANKKAETN